MRTTPKKKTKTKAKPAWAVIMRTIRQRWNLNQTEFGKVLGGFNASQISKYENAEITPPLRFWRAFARTFGANLNFIIGGRGSLGCQDFHDTPERKKFLSENSPGDSEFSTIDSAPDYRLWRPGFLESGGNGH